MHTVFFNSIFKDLAQKNAPIERYQVIRKSRKHFLVKLKTWKKLNQNHKDFLLNRLAERFGTDCNFIIEYVNKIDRTSGGKYRAYYEEAFE